MANTILLLRLKLIRIQQRALSQQNPVHRRRCRRSTTNIAERNQRRAFGTKEPLEYRNHRPGSDRCIPQARSALDGQEPGDVCRRSGQRADDGAAHRQHHPPSRRLRLQSADHALALVHGAVCQLCRGHGRRPRQGAGRHAAQGQGRDHRATL